MLLAILIVFALAVGSFLTVAADAPDGQAWFKRTRSRCPHCHHKLGVRDLVPVFSFICQRGRCRHCGVPIPRWHLWTELATVALFLLGYASGVRGVELALLLIAVSILLALTITDLRFWVLPDSLVGALAAIGVAKAVLLGVPTVSTALAGGALGLGLLGGLVLATRGRAMGWGDVKLAGAMGVLLGVSPMLFALLLAFVAGGAFGAILILLRRATLKSHVPFGPFLAGATVLLLLIPAIPRYVLLFFGFN
jgi:prepilin signal peptidase PulO-like enzyme (type II secretory pathway)